MARKIYDILKNDAFSYASLQESTGKVPYIPSAIAKLNIFTPEPIDTRVIHLFEEDGSFSLIPMSTLGAPDTLQTRNQGEMRVLRTSRLSKRDYIRAGELEAVLSKPTDLAAVETLAGLLSKRQTQLKSDMEATKEFHRLAGLRGKLYDVDGTLKVDFFAAYGIVAPTTVEFDFANIPEGALATYIRQMIVNPTMDVLLLKGRATSGTSIGALVGGDFFEGLIAHPDVRDRWKAQEQAQLIQLNKNPLLQGVDRWEAITVGGVTFVHYRNSVGSKNANISVGAKEAIFFPIGAADVFKAFFSPGETFHEVGKLGEPEYTYLETDLQEATASWVSPLIRSYPLYACTLPGALMSGESE